MKIFISQSNNIYFNLALENWLFLEALENEQILFLWQNSPCVVIGRAQNPWQECYLKAMNNDNISVVRRQSGGGTVYHDMGNINYTIISPKKEHLVKKNLEFVCNTVQKLGIEVHPNCRNDIVIDHNNFTYKVSGSAFREKKDRAFHHGTLLINADTQRLYQYLHQPIDTSLDAKGVKSHRSKVLNLNQIKTDLTTDDILRAFITTIKQSNINFINENTPLTNYSIIDNEITKLQSWDWTFGKTLPFSKTYKYQDETLSIDVKGGIIQNIVKNDNVVDISNKSINFNQELEFDDISTLLKL